MKRAAALSSAAALAAAPLSAHDFWIEPSTFRPQVGENGDRAASGSARTCRASRFARVSKLIVTFALFSSAGTTPLSGRDGDDPAGSRPDHGPGSAVHRIPEADDYRVSIDAAKFEDYLKEEGLEEIAKLRATRGETQKPAREVFSRAAKALLDAGTPAGSRDGTSTAISDFTLELLADRTPTRRPGLDAAVSLALRGQASAGAPGAGAVEVAAGEGSRRRTDAKGRVGAQPRRLRLCG
jgi:hypothetical protein